MLRLAPYENPTMPPVYSNKSWITARKLAAQSMGQSLILKKGKLYRILLYLPYALNGEGTILDDKAVIPINVANESVAPFLRYVIKNVESTPGIFVALTEEVKNTDKKNATSAYPSKNAITK